MAHQVGRTGLRALLLRLQEQDPEWPVHVFAHSLGSDVVLTALAPESAAREPSTEVESPERVLSLGMVVLAGADLDQDLFARRGRAEARLALDRARAWWITVPRDQEADAALELRRAAGRRDAMGNRGLTLLRDDFERLMERRGLVLDKRQIPIRHAYTDYYSRRRMRSLVASLAYLEEPDRPLARQSPLAAIDRVMLAAQPRLEAYVRRGGSTEQLYAQWRLEPDASRFGPVRVVEGRREARVVPEAASCPIPRAVQFLRPMTRLPRSEPPRHVPAL